MPRARCSDMPQRVSPRGPAPLRTSSSDSDPLRQRSITDRSPKLGDRRSPRNAHSEPVNQKKLGTRIAGLESQLEQAQGELKILKDQLASAEAAKKEAQKELEKKTTKLAVPAPISVQDQRSSPNEIHDLDKEVSNKDDIIDDNQKETDVFEVPVEKLSMDTGIDFSEPCDQDKLRSNPVDVSPKSPDIIAFEQELAVKNEVISLLKVKNEEKEKELETLSKEHKGLKQQLNEAGLEISSAKSTEEKMNLKMNQLEEDLEKSRKNGDQLKERLKEMEEAKETLETEMKKLRVQTEQWRKAADAAAAVLAGGVDMNGGRRISERCGSMDKHYASGVFETSVGGYPGFVDSPGLGDDSDDGFGSGKRKGSGIKMFGDLWKKKGQK